MRVETMVLREKIKVLVGSRWKRCTTGVGKRGKGGDAREGERNREEVL